MTSQQEQKAQRDLRILTLLRSSALMEGVDTKYLKKMVAVATEVEFPADTIIYRRGDAGQAIYLVEEGTVNVEMAVSGHEDERLTIVTIKPGQFFGWSALFPSERKQAWTHTVTRLKAIAFNAAKLREACKADQQFEYVLVRRAIKSTSYRMEAIRRQVKELV